MNERIKQLAEQADIVFGFDKNNDPEVICAVMDIEKFAKLIVNECIGCLYPQLNEKYSPEELLQQAKYRKLIKEHFGVNNEI